MLGHLTDIIRDTRAGVSRSVRQANLVGLTTDAAAEKARELATGEEPDRSIATRTLQDFCGRCGVEIIDSALAPSGEVTDRYFKRSPPFADVADKKKEFPDAIALTSLQAWAQTNNYKIIVVSRDDGWKRFCKSTASMHHQFDLPAALSLLQPHSYSTYILSALNDEIIFGTGSSKILALIESTISDCINNAEVDVEAHSPYYYEPDDAHAVYKSTELQVADGQAEMHLLSVSSAGAVIAIPVEITFDVKAHFMLWMTDPIDKDEIRLPSQDHILEDQQVRTDVFLTLTGDFSKGLSGIVASDVEVIEELEVFDFGELGSPWDEDREAEHGDYRD